jgi:hypothetical protein
MTASAVSRCSVALFVAATTLSACSFRDDPKGHGSAGEKSDPVGLELQTTKAHYPAGDAPQLSMVLRNNGSRECSLPSTAIGAAEVVSVQRDGVALIGRPNRVYLYDGVAGAVAGSLRNVAPGESITVPLDIERSPNGIPEIVSTGEEAGGARTTSWTLDQPGVYRIIAVMSPATGVDRPDIAPKCEATSAEAEIGFEVEP